MKPINPLSCARHHKPHCPKCQRAWAQERLTREARERERHRKAQEGRWPCRHCGTGNPRGAKGCAACLKPRYAEGKCKPKCQELRRRGKRCPHQPKRRSMEGVTRLHSWGGRERWLEERLKSQGQTSIVILKTTFRGPKPKWGDPFARPSMF